MAPVDFETGWPSRTLKDRCNSKAFLAVFLRAGEVNYAVATITWNLSPTAKSTSLPTSYQPARDDTSSEKDFFGKIHLQDSAQRSAYCTASHIER
jgi:hypothetical protein